MGSLILQAPPAIQVACFAIPHAQAVSGTVQSVCRVEGPPECLAVMIELLRPFYLVHPGPHRAEVQCKLMRLESFYAFEAGGVCHFGSCLEVTRFCEWWMVACSLSRRLDLCQIHGAAVADERGAILMPGRSGCGKTTLTLGLYNFKTSSGRLLPLCDDVILLERTGRLVRPFKRCFHIDRATLEIIERLGLGDLLTLDPLPEGFCRPEVWSDPRIPRLLIFPEYCPGAALHLERLRPARAWMMLVNHLIASPDLGGTTPHFETLSALINSVEIYRMVHSDLAVTAAALDKLLSTG
ncbi:MAG: hypothetical protein H7Y22_13315 [Gemmatimonadaceae bacterium]|nr:hypothetical protein [Gloeobacterales cyanobacterium ES-bin-141]